MRYVAAQKAAVGCVPTGNEIVFERFFDESGGMQLVIHAPLGARINKAWGLALRKRFCRSFDFELQAAADDNGVLLSIGPQHSFPIDSLFGMLNSQNGRDLLEQAVSPRRCSASAGGGTSRGPWPCCGRTAASGAAVSAEVPQRGFARRGLPRNGRLPGKSSRPVVRFPISRSCGRRCTTA